jgi:hypothetical protein
MRTIVYFVGGGGRKEGRKEGGKKYIMRNHNIIILKSQVA